MQSPQYEFEISCKKLLDTDTFSKSDPLCKVYVVDHKHKRLQQLGQTEKIKNNLNPIFKTKIKLSFPLNPGHLLEFLIQDDDTLCNDNLGKAIVDLNTLVHSGMAGYTTKLKKSGVIKIIAYQIGVGDLELKMRGMKIKSKDFLGKSDPFITLSQMGNVIYKSEFIKDTKEPNWKFFKISLSRINADQPLQIVCYDDDGPDSKADLIGEARFTPRMVSNGQGSKTLDLISKHGKFSGSIILDTCVITGGGMMNTGNTYPGNMQGNSGFQQGPGFNQGQRPGFPQQGFQPNQQGFQQNQQGFPPNQQGFPPNQQGYQQGYQQPGMPQAGFLQANQGGYPQANYNQPGFNPYGPQN